MRARKIDGRAIAATILERLRLQLAELAQQPRLISLYIGDDQASAVYIRNQKRTSERLGVRFDLDHLPETVTEEELTARIHRFNEDRSVTGILLQRPLPPHLRLQRIQSQISPEKDVEGLHPTNIGSIVYGTPRLVPCTALAAIRCLLSTGLPLRGADIVMIGHSEVVGKPIAFLMLNFFATATICHVETQDLSRKTRGADAIFTAVGKPGLLTGDMIKPGAVVIDIGIRQVPLLDREGEPLLDEQGRPRHRLSGDADDSVAEVASWLTPVPGGVGPVTVTMLLHNTVLAARGQEGLGPEPLFEFPD